LSIIIRANRNISRRKTRTLLVLAALSLSLAMIISIPPSITASQQATQTTIDQLTSTAEFISSTVNMAATEIDCQLPLEFRTNAGPYQNETRLEQPLMNYTDYGNLTAIPNVAAVAPILEQSADDWFYSIYGLPLDNTDLLNNYPILLPTNITEGRNLRTNDKGVVILSYRIADHYNIKVGGTINIFGKKFEIVGIAGQEALNTTRATMNIIDAQTITNNTDKISEFKVFADSAENVYTVNQNIIGAYPKVNTVIAQTLVNQVFQMQNQINEQREQAESTMNQIQTTGFIEMGIITIASGGIVLFIMLYTVRERTKEIGTLKAIGASSSNILGQFILEGILLSLIAGGIGIIIGIFGATSLANVLLPAPIQTGIGLIGGTTTGLPPTSTAAITVNVTPKLMLFGLGVAVALGSVGSLYPAWRASRVRPAEAMRYE